MVLSVSFMRRKPVIGVIGGNTQTASSKDIEISEEVGKELIDAGYRIICGGLGGVMESVARGAHSSERYTEGSIIGILPGLSKDDASPFCDIIIVTGMNLARNQIIVASADAIVAIGGGAGTLSEIAYAWQYNKPIYAFQTEGWSGKVAGKTLDFRGRTPIYEVNSPAELIHKLQDQF